MAFDPDNPVAGGAPGDPGQPPDTPDDAPAAPQQPRVQGPSRLEIDRMTDAVMRGVGEQKPAAQDAAMRQARARQAHANNESGQNRPPDVRNVHPFTREAFNPPTPGWARRIGEGITSAYTKIGEAINRDAAKFPTLGLPDFFQLSRRASRHIEENTIAPNREHGYGVLRNFFDIVSRSELCKAYKIAAREQRGLPSKSERDAILAKIVKEQPSDPKERERQDEKIHRFNDCLARGDYAAARREYDDVLQLTVTTPLGTFTADSISSEALVASHIEEEALERALKRNKGRKPAKKEKTEDIERRLFPEGTNENIRRNELLQRYLRIMVAQHIADMAEGRIEPQRFTDMYRDLRCLTHDEFTRDDIPLGEQEVQDFFHSIRDDVTADIREACRSIGHYGERVPIKQRAYSAVKFGILTMDDLRAIDSNIDRYILDDAEPEEPGARERILAWLAGIRDRAEEAHRARQDAHDEATRARRRAARFDDDEDDEQQDPDSFSALYGNVSHGGDDDMVPPPQPTMADHVRGIPGRIREGIQHADERLAGWAAGVAHNALDAIPPTPQTPEEQDRQEAARQRRAEQRDREDLNRQGATERQFAGVDAGLVADRTPEREMALRMLDDAWRRDIASDTNDVYSNFDTARARVLERWDVFPKVRITQEVVKGEIVDVDKEMSEFDAGPIRLDVELTSEINELKARQREIGERITRDSSKKGAYWQQSLERDRESLDRIEVEIRRLEHEKPQRLRANRHEQYEGAQLLTPREIQSEILDSRGFREAVMDRLIRVFEEDYSRFYRQLVAVRTDRGTGAFEIHDDGRVTPITPAELNKKSNIDKEKVIIAGTHWPYQILDNRGVEEVRGRIRQGPARQKLIAAMLRGEPALHAEEDALVAIRIFSQEEIDTRHYYMRQIVFGRERGVATDDVEQASIDEGVFTQEEMDAIRSLYTLNRPPSP